MLNPHTLALVCANAHIIMSRGEADGEEKIEPKQKRTRRVEPRGNPYQSSPPPGKYDKDAAAGALASLAAASAKAAHTDLLKARQDGLKTRLATLQFEFQLLQPTDDDFSARIKILREEVNSMKKDTDRLLEEARLAPATAMPARLAIPGQGRTPSSSTAVRAVLGAAPSAAAPAASGSGYTSSSSSVHTPMLPTAVSGGDGDDDDDDDDDEDYADNQHGNTQGSRGRVTHQVTLNR